MRHSGGVNLGSQATPESILHLRGSPSVHGSLTLDQESADPASPAATSQARLYVKNAKLVVQWNDGSQDALHDDSTFHAGALPCVMPGHHRHGRTMKENQPDREQSPPVTAVPERFTLDLTLEEMGFPAAAAHECIGATRGVEEALRRGAVEGRGLHLGRCHRARTGRAGVQRPAMIAIRPQLAR